MAFLKPDLKAGRKPEPKPPKIVIISSRLYKHFTQTELKCLMALSITIDKDFLEITSDNANSVLKPSK